MNPDNSFYPPGRLAMLEAAHTFCKAFLNQDGEDFPEEWLPSTCNYFHEWRTAYQANQSEAQATPEEPSAVEPEGHDWAWAVGMMKAGHKVMSPSLLSHNFIYENPYNKGHFIDNWGFGFLDNDHTKRTDWQLYTEPTAEPEYTALGGESDLKVVEGTANDLIELLRSLAFTEQVLSESDFYLYEATIESLVANAQKPPTEPDMDQAEADYGTASYALTDKDKALMRGTDIRIELVDPNPPLTLENKGHVFWSTDFEALHKLANEKDYGVKVLVQHFLSEKVSSVPLENILFKVRKYCGGTVGYTAYEYMPVLGHGPDNCRYLAKWALVAHDPKFNQGGQP